MTVPAIASLQALLISLGTANMLAYIVLLIVAIFLISGPVIVYVFYKKHKREAAVAPTQPNSA